MKEYKKITNGFVVQDFKIVNGIEVCTGQEFIASDGVDYEDENGNSISEQQGYFNFEMVQPLPENKNKTISLPENKNKIISSERVNELMKLAQESNDPCWLSHLTDNMTSEEKEIISELMDDDTFCHSEYSALMTFAKNRNKVLTDSERLEVAMSFVSDNDLDDYSKVCEYMEKNNCDFDTAFTAVLEEEEN